VKVLQLAHSTCRVTNLWVCLVSVNFATRAQSAACSRSHICSSDTSRRIVRTAQCCIGAGH